MDVDCSTKTANENSKKVFLLIKDNELEITMTFSWWQFRKLIGEIRFFFPFCFFKNLVHLSLIQLQQTLSWNPGSCAGGEMVFFIVWACWFVTVRLVVRPAHGPEDQTTEEERSWEDSVCFEDLGAELTLGLFSSFEGGRCDCCFAVPWVSLAFVNSVADLKDKADG